jgi:hypothetical protein
VPDPGKELPVTRIATTDKELRPDNGVCPEQKPERRLGVPACCQKRPLLTSRRVEDGAPRTLHVAAW